MQERGRYIELRTSDGKPICRFYLLERDIGVDEKEKKPENASPQNHQPRNGGGNGNGNGRRKPYQTNLQGHLKRHRLAPTSSSL